jgi:c-di-GMP-binding flagellar brake protein YcgR
MGKNFCETGSYLFVRVKDINFKGRVSVDKASDRITIEVPVCWLPYIEKINKDDNCTITCKSGEKEGYLVGTSSVVDKKLDALQPLLTVTAPKKVVQRKELRRFKRFGVFIFTCIYEGEGDKALIKPINGTVVDISLGGCLVLADYQFKIGDFMVLDFSVNADEENVHIKCSVKNIRPFYESKMNLYGLEFADMDVDTKDKLEQFLATLHLH